MKPETKELLAERIDVLKLEIEDVNTYAELLVLSLYGSLEQDLISAVTDYLLTGEYWDRSTRETIFYDARGLIDYVENY